MDLLNGKKGHDDLTSYAHEINSNGWEKDLSMIFVVINNQSKVSSRSGMSLTRDTSRFYQYWLDHVDEDLNEAKEAVKTKIFNA